MAKYYGAVGYAEDVVSAPGVSSEEIVERMMRGDVIKRHRRITAISKVEDDVDVSNQISVVADAYAFSHFHNIRYATWSGVKWKVTSVEVQRPRLILSLGGVYNENET